MELAAVMIAGCLSLATAVYVFHLARRERRVETDLAACLADRRLLRQNMQLIVSSLIGLLPDRQRIELLTKVDESIRPENGGRNG